MIANPINKYYEGEHMTWKSSSRDFAIGAVAGLLIFI